MYWNFALSRRCNSLVYRPRIEHHTAPSKEGQSRTVVYLWNTVQSIISISINPHLVSSIVWAVLYQKAICLRLLSAGRHPVQLRVEHILPAGGRSKPVKLVTLLQQLNMVEDLLLMSNEYHPDLSEIAGSEVSDGFDRVETAAQKVVQITRHFDTRQPLLHWARVCL